ncbi:ankyrin repeat domain-containing protein [Cyclobacterium plantarum]|nr:ankyrin repeat domain-containing protein [Cyclobacterium plantarum]
MKTKRMNAFVCIGLLLALSFGCSPSSERRNEKGNKAPDMDIHAAVLAGNVAVVKQHIDAGSNINKKEPLGGATPLISAITFGKGDIARQFIDAGADLSAKNNDGSTALHVAAFFCRVELVQALLDAAADKSLRNEYGATPRETVMGPFEAVKPVYEMMQTQLGPLGLQLDLKELEKTRPVIAMMLQ